MEYNIAQSMQTLPFSEIRSVMEKATQMEQAGKKVIHLELGRPDFDTPAFIKEACLRSLEKGNVFYTSNYGTPQLRAAIANKLREENHIDYSPDEVLVTVGLSEAVYAVMSAILNPGDEILVPDPVWLNYIHLPRYFGATPVSYSLLEENNFQIDVGELEGKITGKTRAIVLISPNNPTGGVLGAEALEAIASIAKKHNLIVISDEVYEKIIYDKKHVSIASLPGMKERTVTLNGMSKAYSMTGWRLGYAAAPKELISAMVRKHMYVTTCAPSFVQEASVLALEKGQPEIDKMVAEYRRRRDYAVEALNSIPGLSCQKPDGAFYIFLNVKQLGRPCEELASYYLEEAGLAMVPGTAFGSLGEGYIRLSYACSYENIAVACQKLKEATEKLMNPPLS